MKKIYVKPQTEQLALIEEGCICIGTNVAGDNSNSQYETIHNNIDQNPNYDDDGPGMTAKGGDFFEESISPSSGSIWGDED